MPTNSNHVADQAAGNLARHKERILSAARRRVAMHPPNPHLASKSQRQYEWVHAALIRDAARSGEPFNVVLETRSSRATFEFGRNCIRHCEARALADFILRLEAFDEGDIDGTVALLDQMQISLARLEYADEAKPPLETRRRTRATRLKLHPADWQKLLIADAPGKLKIALLILHLTGCRPCEIERGIQFHIGRNGSDVRLTLDIVGAKCDDYRGQPLRTFQFLSEDLRPMLSELIANLIRYMEQVPSPVFRLGDVTKRVSRRARMLWPSHQAHPTAYSFRYAFREHMALLGATRHEIARAMGHQSISSSLSYGRQMQRERTQDLVMEISASIEPRYPDHRRDDGQRWREERVQTRLVARDLAHEPYQTQQL